MHLVCAACAATNRVPDARLADGPVCGVCKEKLLDPRPFALTDDRFANYVSKTELPIVVDFWAAWCGPCKMMAPFYAEAAKQMPFVRFAKVDTEVATQTAARFTIRSIPTLIIFQGGQEIARQSGAMRAADIVGWVKMHASAPT